MFTERDPAPGRAASVGYGTCIMRFPKVNRLGTTRALLWGVRRPIWSLSDVVPTYLSHREHGDLVALMTGHRSVVVGEPRCMPYPKDAPSRLPERGEEEGQLEHLEQSRVPMEG